MPSGCGIRPTRGCSPSPDGSRSSSEMEVEVPRPVPTGRASPGSRRHQKMIIQKLWMRAEEADKEDCSKNIMAHLLRSNNQLYQVFSLTGMTDKEIVSSSRFNRLASNFGTVFDFVITNFDDLKKVAFALECLGGHHANFGIRQFGPYWPLFCRVFEDNPPRINPQRKTSNTLHVDRAF
ncbi:hypothetical protein M3Y99_01780900 [Aphelenchoides fujianensis]|nr:hypothetical protein M3Y99_01780900 [Aphelenchoides fujianensis]